MIDVYLSADGQKLKVTQRPDVLIAGTRGVVRLNFTLSPDWYGYKVVADFDGDAEPLVGGTCMLPDSVAGMREVPVRLVGVRGKQRMYTETATIVQRKG